MDAIVLQNPIHVFLLCRDGNEGAEARSRIRLIAPYVTTTVILCDLADFASIRKTVYIFTRLMSRLDILICNAGACTFSHTRSVDRYEYHFAVNHLGHALLIRLLMPTLNRSCADLPGGDIRIIFISCDSHKWAPEQGIDYEEAYSVNKGLSWKQRYGQSKLANILYARRLAEEYPAITSVSVDPGFTDTKRLALRRRRYLHSESLVRRFGPLFTSAYRSVGGKIHAPKEAAETAVWCAGAWAEDIINGEYYDGIGSVGRCSDIAQDMNEARDLWARTRALLQHIPYRDPPPEPERN